MSEPTSRTRAATLRGADDLRNPSPPPTLHDVHVLIPLRSPGEGKTRLGPALGMEDRARIAAAMLADVVVAVRGAGQEPQVVASGAAAAAAAAALDCDVLLDRIDDGLNAALHDATSRLAPHAQVLVLLADLPYLAAGDVAALLATSGPVVLAPNDDGGTSALLRRPYPVMPIAFGPASADAHRGLGRQLGIEVVEVDRPGLATDLDTTRDLAALRRDAVGTTLRRVLVHLDGQVTQ